MGALQRRLVDAHPSTDTGSLIGIFGVCADSANLSQMCSECCQLPAPGMPGRSHGLALHTFPCLMANHSKQLAQQTCTWKPVTLQSTLYWSFQIHLHVVWPIAASGWYSKPAVESPWHRKTSFHWLFVLHLHGAWPVAANDWCSKPTFESP